MNTAAIAFIEFCERKPEGENYDYHLPTKCAVAQYLSSVNAPKCNLFTEEIDAMFGVEVGDAVVDGPHTFGALAARLRASL